VTLTLADEGLEPLHARRLGFVPVIAMSECLSVQPAEGWDRSGQSGETPVVAPPPFRIEWPMGR